MPFSPYKLIYCRVPHVGSNQNHLRTDCVNSSNVSLHCVQCIYLEIIITAKSSRLKYEIVKRCHIFCLRASLYTSYINYHAKCLICNLRPSIPRQYALCRAGFCCFKGLQIGEPTFAAIPLVKHCVLQFALNFLMNHSFLNLPEMQERL